MAVFLTTRGTTSELEKIINNAVNGLILVSPFIKVPDSLFQNLKAADQRGVKISIMYGKNQLEPDTLKRLQGLKNAKLYYLENLHAKCYLNETSMIITSLNLYDFSEQNNREMGVLVTKQEDEKVFTEAIREINMMISLATRSDFDTQVSRRPQAQTRPQRVEKTKNILEKGLSGVLAAFFGASTGFCIGCKTKIEYDEFRPYCPECYGEWIKHKWQKAKYCHNCGQQFAASINKPVCRSCWEKTKQYR